MSVVQDLVAMARVYADSMDLASTNTYLWRNAAAPVDVGDIALTTSPGLLSSVNRQA